MGAAILDRKSWGPPSWIGSRGGRHLGSEVTSLALKWGLYYYSSLITMKVLDKFELGVKGQGPIHLKSVLRLITLTPHDSLMEVVQI